MYHMCIVCLCIKSYQNDIDSLHQNLLEILVFEMDIQELPIFLLPGRNQALRTVGTCIPRWCSPYQNQRI